MFMRALKICSNEYLLEEIYFIFSIGRKHKYSDFILDKAYNKALTTFNTDKAISQGKIVYAIFLSYHIINVCKVWYVYSKLISTFLLFLAIIVL